MKRKEGSMMLFVNNDSHEGLDDDHHEVLISEIFDDSVDLAMARVWTLIYEIYLDESFEVDLVDEVG